MNPVELARFDAAVNTGVHEAEPATFPVGPPVRAVPGGTGPVDTVAMARELRRVLEARVADMTSGDIRPVGERRTPRLVETGDPQRQQMITQRIHADQRAITGLISVRNDPEGAATVEETARSRGISIDERAASRYENESRTFTAGSSTERTSRTRLRPDGSLETSRSRSFQVGVDGVTSTRGNATSETHSDGSGHSSDRTATTSATLADGGINVSHQAQQTDGETRTNGTSTEVRTQRSGSVGLNADHALATATASDRTRETDSSGNTAETSRSTSGRAGAVFGADGTGGTAGLTRTNGTAQMAPRAPEDRRTGDNVTQSYQRSVGGDATVTDHGANLAVRGSQTNTRDGFSVANSLGVSGGFHVDVNPIAGRFPTRFEVVTRLELRGNLGTSVNAPEGLGSVGAELSGARITTFRHEMSEDEARAYTRDANAVAAGGSASSAAPEFGVMARIRAARANAHLGELEASRDPEVAARLVPGSSVESSTTYTVTGRASGSVGSAAAGAGVSGSLGTTTTRSVRVGRTADGQVEIHLEFNDEDTASGSANARFDGVSGQVGGSTARGQGRQLTVRLDPVSPTYLADYAEVFAAHGRADAEAVVARLGGQSSRQTHASDARNASIGFAGSGSTPVIAVAGSSTSDERTDIAQGERDASTGTRARLSGTTVGSSDQRGSLEIGGRAVLTSDDSTVATSHVGPRGDQTVDVSQTQSRSMPGLPAAMQRSLQTTQTSLDELRLTDADIATLATRAQSADVWLNSIPGGLILHVQDAWNALGASLRAPHPDPRWSAADATIADKLARGLAITHFIAHVDSGDGLAALRFVADRMSVGQTRQFPAELATESTMFHQAETQVRDAGTYYRGLSGPDRETRVHAYGEHQFTQLVQVLGRVRACTTFRTSAAKVSTITAIQDLITRNDREMFAALAPGAMSADGPATPHERSALALMQLQTYKAEERRHWEHAQSEIQRAGWFANPNDCFNAAVAALEEIAATYPAWLASMHEAEATSPDAPELRALHPNPNWSIQLLRQATHIASAGGQGNPDERAARWLAAANPVHR